MISKLGLGTVQFGEKYGVSNVEGKPNLECVSSILNLARSNGVNLLDTAPTYGDSESVLGFLGIDAYAVVSKAPSHSRQVRSSKDHQLFFQKAIEASLANLGLPSIYGYLLHDVCDLLGTESSEVASALALLKDGGLTKKIGVSVYDPEQLDQILNWFTPDIVQIPMNPFDQRFLKSGMIKRLRAAGVEIHVRSIFLQGLLLMDPRDLVRTSFVRYARELAKWHGWLSAMQLTPIQGCLAFANSQNESIDRFIIGVQSPVDLQEIIDGVTFIVNKGFNFTDDFEQLRSEDVSLINPSLWKIK